MATQVSEATGKVELPTFKPRRGVHIETDPKGTAKPIAHGDDNAVIENLISQLEVSACCFSSRLCCHTSFVNCSSCKLSLHESGEAAV